MTNKIRTYDIPTRIFHWVFGLLFFSSFLIAKNADDESTLFPYHMLIGMTLVAIVLMRLLWGFVGTRYARFKYFKLKPASLIDYFRDLLTRKTPIYPGHNPASSWASILMMVLAIGLGVTGYLMTADGQANKETYEDFHELFGTAFLITVIAHVLGIILHSVRHKDGIWRSMLSGKKRFNGTIPAHEVEAKFGAGLIFIALSAGFAVTLAKHYDEPTRTLRFLGVTLTLGEIEDLED